MHLENIPVVPPLNCPVVESTEESLKMIAQGSGVGVKAEPDSKEMPCCICGTLHPISIGSRTNREMDGYVKAITCRTRGNWGSQIHDESGVLSFIICDQCVIKNSDKMLFKELEYQPEADLGVQNARTYFEKWLAMCPGIPEPVKKYFEQ